MSKGNPKTANLVIEWSPKGVTTFDAVTGKTQNFESVQAAASTLNGKQVLVAVSRRQVFVRTTRVPNASAADVRLVLSMRLGDLFPLPASELAYDFQLTDNVDSDGRLAIVAAMSAQDLRRLHDEFRSVGVKVSQVLPIAFGSVLLSEIIGKSSCAVVSQDEEGLGIDLIDNKVLRYSRVSSNGASVAAEVGRTYTVAGLSSEDIVSTGGNTLADADKVTKETSLSAFLHSTNEIPHINLELPESVSLRAKKARDQRQRTALLLFVASLVVCGGAYSSYNAKVVLADAADAKAQTQIKKAQNLQKNSETKEQTLMEAQNALDLAFKYGQHYSDLVTVIANDVPTGVWLGGISVERGKRLVLRGVAFNNGQVKDYTDKLSAEPRLRNVRLEFANDGSIDLKPVVQFSISAFPVGNVPLVDPNQVRRK